SPRDVPAFPCTTLFRSEVAGESFLHRVALAHVSCHATCRAWASLASGRRARLHNRSGSLNFAPNRSAGARIEHDRYRAWRRGVRSEEHTSELQSRENLV